jgi:hypothetical protein
MSVKIASHRSPVNARGKREAARQQTPGGLFSLSEKLMTRFCSRFPQL